MDLIPSPSVKIQILGGKVCLMCKGKTLLGVVNKLLKKKFVDNTKQSFALLPQLNFPTNNLNFHWRWRWWDQIQAIFLNLLYFRHFHNESLAFTDLACVWLTLSNLGGILRSTKVKIKSLSYADSIDFMNDNQILQHNTCAMGIWWKVEDNKSDEIKNSFSC